MNLLINDKEIANFLFSQLDHVASCRALEINEVNTAVAISDFLDRRNGVKYNPDKDNFKFKDKLIKGISRDLTDYVDRIKSHLKNRKTVHYKLILANIEYFINHIGEEKILTAYKNSPVTGFVKSSGKYLSRTSNFVRRNKFNNYPQDCLFRNTVGNEQLIISKLQNKYPFWFIDSGYTNFIETHKKWHRLTRNHIHTGNYFEAPVDRLGMFTSFPQQWRTAGSKILVIEPGPFAAKIFNVDMTKWKYDVEAELRQYTDKEIVFREKFPKKTRPRLYKELCEDDYYCVVNINSNAATEAVWAGVPVITLDYHVTSLIARDKLSDINNLYRPNLANWLCMLSYSQFTYEELLDGTAARLIKRYHV